MTFSHRGMLAMTLRAWSVVSLCSTVATSGIAGSLAAGRMLLVTESVDRLFLVHRVLPVECVGLYGLSLASD